MDKTNHQLIKGIAAKFAFSQNGGVVQARGLKNLRAVLLVVLYQDP
jgi:hypothetical protein